MRNDAKPMFLVAVTIIWTLGCGRASVATLKGNLHNADPSVRANAANALGLACMGGRTTSEESNVIQAMLVESLSDEEPDVRASAAEALGHIGHPNAMVVGGLKSLLIDEHKNVRCSAASALGELGPDALAAVPALIEISRAGDDDTRCVAMHALSEISPGNRVVVDLFVAALRAREIGIRSTAASALFLFAQSGDEGIAAVMRSFRSDAGDADKAALVLRLESVVDDAGREENERLLSALVLSQLDLDNKKSLQFEIDDLSHGYLKERAAWALGQRGSTAKAAVTELCAVLNGVDYASDVKAQAAHSLGRIGPEAQEAIPVLIAATKSDSVSIKIAANEALARIRKCDEK